MFILLNNVTVHYYISNLRLNSINKWLVYTR